MRTTLDLPDAVFRQLKARAALEGLSLKELLARYVTDGLGNGAGRADRVSEGPVVEAEPFVSVYDAMKDMIGTGRSRHRDLSSNPKHLEDLGRV